MSASVCVNSWVRHWGSEGEKQRERERESVVTNACCLSLMEERMAALGVQLETMRGAVCLLGWISTGRLYIAPPVTHTQWNRTKRLVTAKFTGVTSTVSLTSNSPLYSGYSCYEHLIIVLDACGPATFRLRLIHPHKQPRQHSVKHRPSCWSRNACGQSVL